MRVLKEGTGEEGGEGGTAIVEGRLGLVELLLLLPPRMRKRGQRTLTVERNVWSRPKRGGDDESLDELEETAEEEGSEAVPILKPERLGDNTVRLESWYVARGVEP